MGRYDKIKVYSNDAWRQPSRIQVYNGSSWVDLGLNDSDNKRSLSVQKNNSFVRATLNKNIVSVPGEQYASGSFSIYPKSGYCFNADSNGEWYFRATIRKTSDTAKYLFREGNDDNYIRIIWNANGTISVKCKLNSSSYGEMTVTSSNVVTANNWVYLEVTIPKKNQITINFNGVSTTGSQYNRFAVSNGSSIVGDSGVQFKNTFSIQGQAYGGTTNSKSINLSTASGTTGDYENVTHVNTSTTRVEWI